MHYSIEPRERRCKRLWIFNIAKNIGKSLSNKYGQKLVGTAKKSATDALKTASKRAFQKTAEAIGDLVSNKIADKITSISKNQQGNPIQKNCHQMKLIMKY